MKTIITLTICLLFAGVSFGQTKKEPAKSNVQDKTMESKSVTSPKANPKKESTKSSSKESVKSGTNSKNSGNKEESKSAPKAAQDTNYLKYNKKSPK